MADALVSRTSGGNLVGVRLSPSVLSLAQSISVICWWRGYGWDCWVAETDHSPQAKESANMRLSWFKWAVSMLIGKTFGLHPKVTSSSLVLSTKRKGKCMVIDSFQDEYRFLSNFYPSRIYIDGVEYPTVEHAYQSRKTENPTVRELIRTARTPGEAKRMGSKVVLRSDWEEIKVDTMLNLLRLKFNLPTLNKMLLSTGNSELIEGNYWGDTFWGVCRGSGKNILGKLLMQVRQEIRDKLKSE